jgi:hypothetical protein
MAPLPTRQQLTVDAIYASYEAKQDDGYREHLGASLIGEMCERSLWYSFRWTSRARFTGRMLRLFQTGHLQEDRLVSDLRNIGVQVMSVDPGNGQQWRVRDETGHFGGSMDSVGIGFPEAPKTWHLVEFKTHSLKSFNDLKRNGLQNSKPRHWAQMHTYMHLAGLERGMYLAVCKDNDEIYQERLHADPSEGIRLVAKAGRIVSSPAPLSRIAHTPEWHECRFCDHHPTCWGGALPERHCRSCMHSTPVADGQWHCARHDKLLSLPEQKAGCHEHRYLPPLVSGEQTDAAEDGSWIEYRKPDGTAWKDEGN